MSSSPHILIAFGTRPEAIKLAPLILALRDTTPLTTCAVAQHRQLLDSALATFGISPDIDLDLMVPDQDITALTSRILGRMREVLDTVRPDVLVVQGDTTSAMASALAAYQAGVPVAHVEAGLRTSSLTDPWPEEANRRVISRLAALHFAPTEHAKANLLRENVAASRVQVTGNTGVDAMRITTAVVPDYEPGTVLVTCHRRENQRDGFARAAGFFRELAATFAERDFVLPVHPSPRVQALTQALGSVPNMRLLPAYDYPEMLGAISTASAVITDSGGVQEECAHVGTPCLVTRSETDRPESVATGNAAVVGFDLELGIAALRSSRRGGASEVFGDGEAAFRIAQRLLAFPKRQCTQM